MTNQRTAISVLCAQHKSRLTSRGHQTPEGDSDLTPKQPPRSSKPTTRPRHAERSKRRVRRKHKRRTTGLLQQQRRLKIGTISTPLTRSTLHFQVFQLRQCLFHNIHWLPNGLKKKKKETLLDIFSCFFLNKFHYYTSNTNLSFLAPKQAYN